MDWDFRNDMPIYTQLMDKIRTAIISGELQPGEKLMSVRDFALQAGVNPNTVQRALTDLEREGLVYSQRTAGRFVSEDVQMIMDNRLNMAEEKATEFLKVMEQFGLSYEETVVLLGKVKGER